MTSTLETFSSGDLAIQPVRDGGCLRLVWTGRATARDPRSQITPVLEAAFATAKAEGLTVEMHLVGLQACNSATIASIVDGTRLAREADVAMAVVYDGAVRWQRTSFDALRMFSSRQAFSVRAA